MARICVVLVAGLDWSLVERAQGLKVLGGMKHRAVYEPAFPAVTCTAQATLTTGGRTGEHGIICNGLYTHGREEIRAHLDLTNHAHTRVDVSFWEQSNTLLERPRFWAAMGKKVSMLFWQNSMPKPGGTSAAADIVVTPKPVHTPDGKTMTACWSSPEGLYGELVGKLGPFPLHKYWSPMAGLESSAWILKAAEIMWETDRPDLQLVYVPQLDYNLMRQGPSSAAVVKDLADVDALLAPLAEKVRAEDGILVVMGDYGMTDVTRFVMPNLALREAGLLATKLDGSGKVLVDYDASIAFAMVDHQVAHVYVNRKMYDSKSRLSMAKGIGITLEKLPGIAKALWQDEIGKVGLANDRTGDVVLLATEDAWLVHDWWKHDGEKPRWQFGVDIHSKPGFDTRELFFDPVRKCIAQDAGLVKGSHGLVGDSERWPVVLSDVESPEGMKAVGVASWLKGLMGA